MATVNIENVRVADLPPAWRFGLSSRDDDLVNVQIVERIERDLSPIANHDLEAFGMWKGRTDLDSVGDYVRSIRTSRYTPSRD